MLLLQIFDLLTFIIGLICIVGSAYAIYAGLFNRYYLPVFYGFAIASLLILLKTFFHMDFLYADDHDIMVSISKVAFFEAGIIEECLKFIPIYIAYRYGILTGQKHTLLWGTCIGFGFGISENILYLTNAVYIDHQGFWDIMSMIMHRQYTSLAFHSLLGGMAAVFIHRYTIWALICVVIVHAVYDVFAISSSMIGHMMVIFILSMLAIWWWRQYLAKDPI